MKFKILPFLVMGILIVTSINSFASNLDSKDNIQLLKQDNSVSFSQVQIETKGDYISLNLKEVNSNLMEPGKPMLPLFIKTYKFPMGTKIKNVEFSISDVKQEVITDKIQPAPTPVPLTSIKQNNQNDLEEITEDKSVYSSSDLYPDQWCDYKISCGLDEGKHTIFVTAYCNPIRYSPKENTIYSIENFNVEITYELGKNPIPDEPKYNLVIITPRDFYLSVLPLKNHKEEMGIKTYIKTTESIYREYLFKGRDKPEEIKLFIKDAIEKWGITYVLLMGSRDNQRFKFNIPVRYSNLEDKGGWNETYVSDLYYADIYKGDGEFEDWDSNNNNVFAEWTFIWNPEWGWWSNDINKKDILDLHPDVYLGRLACNNIFEVNTIVNKIINYEKTANGQEWFKKMILAGGDTVPGTELYEGETETNLGASYLRPLGFNITELWTSTGNLTSRENMTNTITQGAGFLYCSGHGNPITWSTHPPNNNSWIDALMRMDMNLLKNGDKLPICVVGGCHNSKFEVGFPNMIIGLLKSGQKYFTWIEDQSCFDKMEWVPNCWSWDLIIQKNGGSIATIGNSGLGWGSVDEGCIKGLDGWITSHFFQVYSEKQSLENCTLGMVHSETLNDYVDEFNPNAEGNELDRKTVEQWILLGDPSLKIGGYPS